MIKLLLKTLFTSAKFYAGAAVLLIGGTGFFFLMNEVVMPRYTQYFEGITVPDVTRISLTEAEERLESIGLRAEVLDRRANVSYPADYIIDQSPSALQLVKPNRKIYLTVNTEERPRSVVPDLMNMSLRNAEMQIQNAGFQMGSISYESSRFRNTILKQSAAPGDTLAKGTVIHLTVSDGLGQRKVPVPELAGLKLTEAQQQIRRSGLRVGEIRFQPSRDVTPNTILSFTPQATELTEGQALTLIVSERFDAIEVLESGAVGADSASGDPMSPPRPETEASQEDVQNSGANPVPGTVPGADPDTDSGAVSGADPDTDSGAVSGADPDTDSGANPTI